MKVSDAFPSKYVSSHDLAGKRVQVVIDRYAMEDLGGDEGEKLALYFKDRKKGMIVNRTNAQIIASEFGDDMDGWLGKEIELSTHKVNFRGKMVDGLTVTPLDSKPQAEDDDEPPF